MSTNRRSHPRSSQEVSGLDKKQMTQETLYWLFSTIAQTLGAVVGIIGMLTIYKFQLISNHVRTLMENSDHLRGFFFGEKHVSQTADQFVKQWAKKREPKEKDPNAEKRKLLNGFYIPLNEFIIARKKIKSRFLLFLIPNLSFIILSIIGLLFCQQLLIYGIWIIRLVVIAMLFTFGSTIYLCYSLVGP